MKLRYEVRKNSDGKKLERGYIKTMKKFSINSNDKLCNGCKMIVLNKKLLPMESNKMSDLLMNIFGKVRDVILAEVSEEYYTKKDNLDLEFKFVKFSKKESNLITEAAEKIKRDLIENDLHDREQYEIKNRICEFLITEHDRMKGIILPEILIQDNKKCDIDNGKFTNDLGHIIDDVRFVKSSLSNDIFWVLYSIIENDTTHTREFLFKTDKEEITIDDCRELILNDSNKMKININNLSEKLQEIIHELDSSDNDILFLEDLSIMSLAKLVVEIDKFNLSEAFDFSEYKTDSITVFPHLLELVEM